MSMQDPISDMLTRIRNGLLSNKKNISIPFSKEKNAIANILVSEGYLLKSKTYALTNDASKKDLIIELKYHKKKPVIELLKRVSRPGLRIYKQSKKIPKVHGGFGISIISTSKGIMSDGQARSIGVGGEVICYVA